MGFTDRAQVLNRLEQELDASVLAFVTGDRAGLQTQISADQLTLFPRHLRYMGHHERIALLLYTRGGEINAAWPIIGFLREHCRHLVVLIPFYAHSCGTILALGADEIHMSAYGTLSPVDPTVVNAFNPDNQASPGTKLPIAVEDVLAFLELAQEGKADEDFAFRLLAKRVHPLALGNVQRSVNQIRQLAQKMLALHSDPPGDGTALVMRLTTELYSHQHLVTRREAREMGLPIGPDSAPIESLLLQYYDHLCADLQLLDRFDPGSLMRKHAIAYPPQQTPTNLPSVPITIPGTTMAPGVVPGLPVQPVTQGVPPLPVRVERGYIETSGTCDAFVTTGEITQQVVPQQVIGMPAGAALHPIVQLTVHTEAWERQA